MQWYRVHGLPCRVHVHGLVFVLQSVLRTNPKMEILDIWIFFLKMCVLALGDHLFKARVQLILLFLNA